MVRYEGEVIRDGRFWLAAIPQLDAMTQGRTRKEALEMILDWVETMVNRPGFKAEVKAFDGGDFVIRGGTIADIG